MDKISCEVIQDLLPLYCDGICSPDSQELVGQHLEHCPQCAGLLEKMREGCRNSQLEEQGREELVKDLASVWKRSVKRSLFRGVALSLSLCLLLAAAYWGLTRMILVPVPADRIEASVEKVTETSVALSLKVARGKTIRASSTKVTEDGRCYIIVKWGLLPEIGGASENWAGDFGISRERKSGSGERVRIREIYYGTKEEHVLLWREE